MASTNKTTNYELSQFIETDRPAWLTDYNGDMRKLDTALKSVSDVASGASGGISSLTDRMTAAEGAITTNTNDISALDARADALEAGAQSTAGTIANIQTEQTAQNLGIEAATELGYNLARPYDSASTYTVGDYVLFQNTLYKCVTAIATGEAFDPTKWLAIKATDEISAGGVTITTRNLTANDVSRFTITGSKITNVYSASAPTQTDVAFNSSLISQLDNSTLIKVGKLNIIDIRPVINFDAMQIEAKTMLKYIISMYFDEFSAPTTHSRFFPMQIDANGLVNPCYNYLSYNPSTGRSLRIVMQGYVYNANTTSISVNSVSPMYHFVYVER